MILSYLIKTIRCFLVDYSKCSSQLRWLIALIPNPLNSQCNHLREVSSFSKGVKVFQKFGLLLEYFFQKSSRIFQNLLGLVKHILPTEHKTIIGKKENNAHLKSIKSQLNCFESLGARSPNKELSYLGCWRRQAIAQLFKFMSNTNTKTNTNTNTNTGSLLTEARC